MGTANGISIQDVDVSDTVDVSIRYSDIVVLYQIGCEMVDYVADAWLQHLTEGT